MEENQVISVFCLEHAARITKNNKLGMKDSLIIANYIANVKADEIP